MKYDIEDRNKIFEADVEETTEETTDELIESLRFLREELREKYNIPERK